MQKLMPVQIFRWAMSTDRAKAFRSTGHRYLLRKFHVASSAEGWTARYQNHPDGGAHEAKCNPHPDRHGRSRSPPRQHADPTPKSTGNAAGEKCQGNQDHRLYGHDHQRARPKTATAASLIVSARWASTSKPTSGTLNTRV